MKTLYSVVGRMADLANEDRGTRGWLADAQNDRPFQRNVEDEGTDLIASGDFTPPLQGGFINAGQEINFETTAEIPETTARGYEEIEAAAYILVARKDRMEIPAGSSGPKRLVVGPLLPTQT